MNPTNPRLEDFELYFMLDKLHKRLYHYSTRVFNDDMPLEVKTSIKRLSAFLFYFKMDEEELETRPKGLNRVDALDIKRISLNMWKHVLLPAKKTDLILLKLHQSGRLRNYQPVREGSLSWYNYFQSVFDNNLQSVLDAE